MSSLLHIQNVSLTIADKRIINDLSFSLDSAMCVGVLGVNGSGKTSLLHAISGLKKPEQGQVLLQGAAIDKIPAKSRAKKLGLLLQKNDFVFPVTVLDTLITSRYAHSSLFAYSKQDKELVKTQLDYWGLADKQQQLVSTLSGGETQRLALAMVACQNPEVFLLDEPMNNLDLRYHHLVSNFFGKNAKKSSLIVLHDLALVPKLCSHLLLLSEGKWQFGRVEELYTKPILEELYGVKMQEVATPDYCFYQAG